MDILICVNNGVERQVKRLKKIIPSLRLEVVPEGNGIFIPSWKAISKVSYQDAVLKLLSCIGREYGLRVNNFYSTLSFEYLKTSETSIAQSGGFLSEISVFGNKNLSATEAEEEVEKNCLGVYEFLIILASNFEKFAGRALFVVCAADRMCPVTGSREMRCTPILKIGNGELSLFGFERDQKLSFWFAFGKS